jgi:hypothetical protein
MDRAMIEQHLAQVEGHVSLGLEHIAKQLQIITRLKIQGHADVEAEAIRLLGSFEEMQREHVAHRNRLLKELMKAK